MDSKWRTLSSKTVLKDRWIDVRADCCVTASGHEISPYYVLRYPDWVHVVAITPEDDLVLVRQYRHGAGATFLELPAGTADANDADPLQTAARELEEETGYRARHLRLVASLYANPANQTNMVHVVLGTHAELVSAPQLDDGEDGLTVETMKIRDIQAGLRSGLIQQALQVSSLVLALSASGHLSL